MVGVLADNDAQSKDKFSFFFNVALEKNLLEFVATNIPLPETHTAISTSGRQVSYISTNQWTKLQV